MKRHIKAPTHPCTYCVKKFSIRSDRDNHEYTLMNIKLFQCTICSAKFKQKNGLINHKVHEEPTEICQKCDQVFSSKSNLKIHQITHSDEATFECKSCGKLFKRASDLKKHKEFSCLNSLAASINNFCEKVARDKLKNPKKDTHYTFFRTKT